jgi:hypothetical protein
MTTAPDKAKTKKEQKPPVTVSREPSTDLRHLLRATTMRMIKDGFSYREAQILIRQYMLNQAHAISGGEHTKAGAILGISRDHARDYYERGGDLVR